MIYGPWRPGDQVYGSDRIISNCFQGENAVTDVLMSIFSVSDSYARTNVQLIVFDRDPSRTASSFQPCVRYALGLHYAKRTTSNLSFLIHMK